MAQKYTELQQLMVSTLGLRFTATGWSQKFACRVCNDHTKRAYFKLEDDGAIGYNCYRGSCSAACVYRPNQHISRKFKTMLRAYGIAIPLELMAKLTVNASSAQFTPFDANLYNPHFYNPMQLPTEFVRYNPRLHATALKYLTERYIDDKDFFVDGSQQWLHAPMRYYEDVIGYQSIKLSSKFYLKSNNNTDMIFFPGGEIPEEPIICEGVIDALSVPFGIGVLQSTVSAKQAHILRNCRPILLPDKEGSRFLEVARRYGWRIIVPSYEEKDSNKAMIKYGRLVLAELLRDNIYDNITAAELKFKAWRNGIT